MTQGVTVGLCFLFTIVSQTTEISDMIVLWQGKWQYL